MTRKVTPQRSWTRWKSVYKIIKNHGGGRQKNRPPEKEKQVLTFPRADAIIIKRLKNARVVELVDSLASGASAHSGRAGSTPASRTNKNTRPFWTGIFAGAKDPIRGGLRPLELPL